MKKILLTQGQEAIVDDDLYEWLLSFGKWFAYKHRHTFYARRSITTSEGRRSILTMQSLIIHSEPGKIIDHINQNGLDNRRENLRNVTESANRRNSKWTKGSSGYYGVWKRRNKYRAGVYLEGDKQISLGTFTTPEAAALAYDRKSIELGRLDKLNFPLSGGETN